MKTFKHSGDLGDIIYSLPLIREMGGGTLLLDTTGGESDPLCTTSTRTKTKFTKEAFNFIKPLLDVQDYIHECREWTEDSKVDINLNDFRMAFHNHAIKADLANLNLVDLYFEAFDLPKYNGNRPWLSYTEKIQHERKVVLSRTPRYQCKHIWFEAHASRLANDAFFLGLEKEHDLFEWTFDVKLPHVKVKDALEIANYLAGSELLISNGSFILAIAIGLGSLPIIVEPFPTVVFRTKSNLVYM